MMSQTGLVCKLMISGVGILNSPDLTLNVVLEDVALGKSSSHCFSIRIFLSSLRGSCGNTTGRRQGKQLFRLLSL